MSGTFIDGGGHDHVGHGIQAGHGGDSPMHDGGNHHQHAGHTGGEGIISSLLGLNQHGHHGFLAHLLGLDHNTHHQGTGHSTGHGSGGGPGQIPMWAAALQGFKPALLFKGIEISANFWLLIMFLGFISWLFVVYWIRHHEPFSNAVIGTGAAQSATANYDRKMMAEIRDAFPIRTSPDGGSIYVPSPTGVAQSQTVAVGAPNNMQQQPALYSPQASFGTAAGPIVDPRLSATPGFYAVPGAPGGLISAPQFVPSPVLGTAAPMMVPEYAQSGTKVKMIVNR